MSFSFGSPVKKLAKKKSVKKAKKEKEKVPLPTEEQVREDHPGVLAMAEKSRLRKENASQKDKIKDLNEIHMYVCLVFQSEAQKFEFLEKFPDVLCVDEVFVDGESFAKQIGVELTENSLPPHESAPNKKFLEMVKKSDLDLDPVSEIG